MWVIVGVLLGLAVFASLIGFVTGPHSHVFAGVLGVVAAIWLVAMGLSGQSAPLLWALLGADVALTAGVGTLAWKGLTTDRSLPARRSATAIGASTGVAVSDLDPDGLVRVRGEVWSATSLNGRILAGGTIQVIRADRVRLEVWGEDVASPGVPALLENMNLDTELDNARPATPDGDSSAAGAPESDDRRAGMT